MSKILAKRRIRNKTIVFKRVVPGKKIVDLAYEHRFHFYYSLGNGYIVAAFHGNEFIGFLNYSKAGMIWSVEVREDYRGKGIGKALYEVTLADVGKLTTSYDDSSENAKHVWSRLIKKYRCDLNIDRHLLTIYNKKLKNQNKIKLVF